MGPRGRYWRRFVTLMNRLLRPTGMILVSRTAWVDAMFDRRLRIVPVENDRRKAG
jgi:hypothetical protein